LPPRKYDWADGVLLKDHTAKKLDVLRSYFHNYLRVKCTPLNRKFKISIVDGFAGGGIYKCGTSGSPLVFLEELATFADETAIWRKQNNIPELEAIDCLFVVNELDPEANAVLEPLLIQWEVENKLSGRKLSVSIVRKQKPFAEVYPELKSLLLAHKFSNVLFNIDPCGYTQVNLPIIQDILGSFRSAEVFFTFMIGSLFNYSSWLNPKKTNGLMRDFCGSQEEFFKDDSFRKKEEWLGTVEKIIYDEFSTTAKFASPFAINQSGNSGYNYWLMHFANSHRAREVYNDILYKNSGVQAHRGKSGLKMLGYTSNDPGVRTFDWGGDLRVENINSLQNDLPNAISEFGDAVEIQTLKASIYNGTTSHSDDIKSVLIDHTDIEVLTKSGGKRRTPGAISDDDIVRLNDQRQLFPILQKLKKPKK